MPSPPLSDHRSPAETLTGLPESRSAIPVPELTGTCVGGKYRIVRLIGRGGMGTVWEGRHERLGHAVAIKFIHPHLSQHSESRVRFEVEARAAARLKSRYVAAVYDHGITEQGQPYIVMEYLDGITLDRAIVERGPLSVREMKHIVMCATGALEVARAAGVVHRDLKPDNVFLAHDPDGSRYGFDYTAKLVDFGIAKLLHDVAATGAGATQAGMVLGTPHFMSPEALTSSAPVGPLTDLWSLGACVYASLVGRLPFDGVAIGEVLLKVCSAPLPVPSQENPTLPKSLDAWFARACARDPAQRFQTPRQFAEAFTEACEEGAQIATAIPAPSGDTVAPHQFRLVPRVTPQTPAAWGPSSSPAPRWSLRMAVAAGLIFGSALAIMVAGGIAWKQKLDAEGTSANVREGSTLGTLEVDAGKADR